MSVVTSSVRPSSQSGETAARAILNGTYSPCSSKNTSGHGSSSTRCSGSRDFNRESIDSSIVQVLTRKAHELACLLRDLGRRELASEWDGSE